MVLLVLTVSTDKVSKILGMEVCMNRRQKANAGSYIFKAMHSLDVLVSTEDSVIELSLLRLDADLLHMHGSFNGFANAYNELHVLLLSESKPPKRPLDRRRLSDAYFRYVMLSGASQTPCCQ